MCHNSLLINEQIEKCMENGMPTKIINTIKFTMRKRKETNKNQSIITHQNSINSSKHTQEMNPQESTAFVSKCPFGHGKLTTPAATFSFTSLAPPTVDSEFEFSNNNNNDLYEQFPQISKLTTTTTASTATENGNVIRHLNGQFDDDDGEKLLLDTKKIYNNDILAQSTQLTREFAHTMQQALRRLRSSKTYTLLTKTTQPAHLAAVGIFTFVVLTVWPELIDTSDGPIVEQSANRQQHIASVPRQDTSVRKYDMLALIAYLGAFSIHFGAQIWMTFVSGLSLYFSLPRHIFGQCQQILFPKYFSINAVLSITMLILYAKFFFNTSIVAKCVQLGSLALTSAIELLVRLYLAPPLLRLMHEKYKIEGTVGSGKEIGTLVQGDLIKCPHYQRIHKAFRRLHMTVAIGNIITITGSCLQLYNIAGQLQISKIH